MCNLVARYACYVLMLSVSLIEFCVPSAAQEFVSPVDDQGHVIDFQRDIAPILAAKCLECHGPEDAKNDYRVDDQETMLSYVEPGDYESSTLYADYLAVDDEDLIMPPVSKGGPLSAAELALIRVWIQEGAAWPEGATVGGSVPAPEKPAPAPTGLVDRLWGFQGYLHPATVHFPIAILLFGAAFVVLGWKWPAIGTQIPLACLLFGAMTAIAASVMGMSFSEQSGYGGWSDFDMDKEIFWHRWSGVIVAVTSTIFALVALKSLKSENREKLTKVWKVGLLICAGMVGAVGHQGGELTYGHDFYPKAFRLLLGTPEPEPDAKPEGEHATQFNSVKSETLVAKSFPDAQRK